MQRIPRGRELEAGKKIRNGQPKFAQMKQYCTSRSAKPASSGFFTVPFPEIRKSFLTLHKSFNPTREAPFGFLLRFHSFCSPSVFLTIEIRAYSRLRKKRWREERNLGESLGRYNRRREIRESRVSKFAQMKRYCSPLGPRIRPSYLSKRDPLSGTERRLCISLAELR